MKKVLYILVILYFYTGCSGLHKNIDSNQIDCNNKVNPKSLQFLAQQYKCHKK